MKDCFSVITPTGDRQQAFKLCCKMMKHQTLKPFEWIIVDDGFSDTTPPDFPFVKYVKRSRRDREPSHTLPCQIQHVIGKVSTGKVIMMEDDDWYHPDYLMKMSSLLDAHELVGHSHNVYYFLKERQYFIHQNDAHSSLCSSAFRKSIFTFFHHMKLNNPFIDMKLWRFPRIKNKCLYRPDPLMVLGMKQLPGRVGATYNSNRNILRGGLQEDQNFEYLKSIVGKDVEWYEGIKWE